MPTLSPVPAGDGARDVDHMPAHVKNSYVGCDQVPREPHLTPVPTAPASLR